MALNPTTLATAIKAAVDAAVAGMAPTDAGYAAAFYGALASALVTHFTANAVIPATGLLDHGGGTCTGATTIT